MYEMMDQNNPSESGVPAEPEQQQPEEPEQQQPQEPDQQQPAEPSDNDNDINSNGGDDGQGYDYENPSSVQGVVSSLEVDPSWGSDGFS